MAGSDHALGILLKHYRRRAGFSQELLAERACISVRTIAGLEAGEGRRPRIETLRLIADALQLTEDERATLMGNPPESSSPRHILPRALPPLIGREQALAEACKLLTAEETALLTITGPAGVGKTHFANELAHSTRRFFRAGCLWIDLAQLTSSADVAPVIAQTLGLRSPRKLPDAPLLVSHVQAQHWLFIFDNCEHLLPGITFIIAELLKLCPHLVILATSRAPLRLSRESVFSLPPLALARPEGAYTVQELSSIPAVALFLRTVRLRQPERALAARELEAVAAICARMDGLPLAIQLAAAHCRLLAPSEILHRLDQQLALATNDLSDLPERHRSIQAALAWSYALLSPSAQTALQVASVFVGGVTANTLVAVCQIDAKDRSGIEQALLELLELHLIEQGTRGRLTLLGTVRAFAHEQLLASGKASHIEAAYHSSMLESLQQRAAHFGTENELMYLRFCDEESSNFDAILSASALHEQHGYGLQVAIALFRWWELRGYLATGRHWFTLFLTGAEHAQNALEMVSEDELGQGFLAGATLAYNQGDYDQALMWLTRAESIFTQREDMHGQGQSLLVKGGILEKQAGDLDRAEQLYERALLLFERAHDQRDVGRAHLRLGNIWYLRHQLAQADHWYRRALAHLVQTDDLRSTSGTLGNLANLALVQGDLDSAEQLYKQALEFMLLLGDMIFITKAIAQLGQLARKRGYLEDAELLSRQAYVLYHAAGFQFGKAEALRDLGYVYHSMQRPAPALNAFRASLELFSALASQYGIGMTLVGLAHTLFATEEKLLAFEALFCAQQLLHKMGVTLEPDDQTLWSTMQAMEFGNSSRLVTAQRDVEASNVEEDVERVITKLRSAQV